jgi:HK97 family phage major capsid protein
MLKELRNKLAVIAKQMRDMHKGAEEEDRGFTAEELQEWNNLLSDYEDIEKRIQNAERIQQMETSSVGDLDGALPPLEDDDDDGGEQEIRTLAEGRATDAYNDAYNTYLREGSQALEREQRDLLHRYQAEFETRAQGIATDAAGGFTVPEGFAGFITETMQDFSGLLNAANPAGSGGPQLLRTASGNLIPFDQRRHRECGRDSRREYASGRTGFRIRRSQPDRVHVHVVAGSRVAATATR